MKLYFAPGACSLAPHIALIEAGAPFELEKVNLKTKETKAGKDFLAINPMGSVPALEREDGEVLTECAVILQYLAHHYPMKDVFKPEVGSTLYFEHYRWLNFIATEMHKGFTPLFAGPKMLKTAEAIEELKEATLLQLNRKFNLLNEHFQQSTYVLGDQLSMADFYLYNVLGWGKYVGIKLSDYPHVHDYHQRLEQRPSVQSALKAEGLI